MEERENRKVHQVQEIKSFRELLKKMEKEYGKNTAFKYKKEPSAKEPQYIEKTYQEFVNDIKALSTGLLNMGLENKRVIVVSNNRYEWCTTYLAVTTGNMVIVPLDRALPEGEMKTLIEKSEAEAVVFEKKFKEIMIEMKQNQNNNLKTLICMDDEENSEIEKYSDILKKGYQLLENGSNQYENIKIDNHKMAIMLFTSGTTNLPKAVMLSQENICANITAIATWVKLYQTDTLLSFLPMHHTFECTITFLYGLYWGASIAFCDGLKYIQKNLQEYKISVFVAVPLVLETMYKKIQKAIAEKGKTKLINTMSKISNALLKCKIDLRKVFFKQVLDNFGGNLRVVLYGAAPMNKETIIGYNNLGIDLIQGYGLTETSPVISAETDKEKRPGSVGLPLINLQVKIDNPNEEGVGEIVVKGPSVMLGYYKNEEETKKSLKDGWFYTGDYGYLDKDEFLYVTGRKKDVIVLRNGKNVYPQEIEFLINKIPYIVESLVYQREQSNTDTMLCAKIVYDEQLIKENLGEKTEKEYQEIIWKEIKEINKTLPIYKYIKKISITNKPLAKTTTQKVKRYEELKSCKD